MKKLVVQFVKFGLVGVSNTLVNYVIYAAVYYFTGNYIAANVAGWFISVLNAYIWQNIFVFKEDESMQKRVWWKVLLKTYIAYAFTGVFLNSVLLWLWIDVIDISGLCVILIKPAADIGINITAKQAAGYTAPVLNMVVDIPLNFIINKFWAYSQKKS